jgi:hypothetical protein
MKGDRRVSRRVLANVVLGLVIVIFVLAAFAFGPETDEGVVALSLGASLAALGLLQLIWLLAGGEPLSAEVQNLGKETGRLSEEIRAATDTLRDLHRAGIERVYSERGGRELIKEWSELAEEAERIDLLGLTMYHEWLYYEELKELLLEVAGRAGGEVRILVLPPVPEDSGQEVDAWLGNPNYKLRRLQPGEDNGHVLEGYLRSAHESLDELRKRTDGKRLEVRYLKECTPYCMLVRIDGYIYVAPYLASAQGENSFAISVREHSELFEVYRKEFETMWAAEAGS